MHCTPRVLSLISLVFGLGSLGALALAVATDFWLWTNEAMIMEQLPPEVSNVTGDNKFWIRAHSGLWRLCLIYEFEPEMPAVCSIIHYSQQWGRIEEAETTTSIMRSIRKATPVLLSSLLLLGAALGVSVVGNTRRDVKTMLGAVLYIFAALVLAGGVIVYISSVNVEVGHRKPSGPNGSKSFYYKYGWAFFFAGSAFVASMFAAVTNITLYLGKYSQLEDMTMIIPGLDKQAAMAGVKSPSHQHFDNGVQNPILNS